MAYQDELVECNREESDPDCSVSNSRLSRQGHIPADEFEEDEIEEGDMTESSSDPRLLKLSQNPVANANLVYNRLRTRLDYCMESPPQD